MNTLATHLTDYLALRRLKMSIHTIILTLSPVLTVLWSARRLRSLTLRILTLLTVLSAAGFMLMRMLPYTPQFG